MGEWNISGLKAYFATVLCAVIKNIGITFVSERHSY